MMCYDFFLTIMEQWFYQMMALVYQPKHVAIPCKNRNLFTNEVVLTAPSNYSCFILLNTTVYHTIR
jgi:hypothetical protein